MHEDVFWFASSFTEKEILYQKIIPEGVLTLFDLLLRKCYKAQKRDQVERILNPILK